MNPQIENLIQKILIVIGGALMAHGMKNAAALVNSEDMLGAVDALAVFIWSMWSNRQKAIIQKAADSLPPKTVLPATTDAAPVAKVMTPEGATDFIRKPVIQPNANNISNK